MADETTKLPDSVSDPAEAPLSDADVVAKLPFGDSRPASDPPPFAEEHNDSVRNLNDGAAANAMRAEADPDIDTDAVHRMAYQVGQFDTSTGESVLASLAFPPPAAVASEKAVLDANAARAVVDPKSPVVREDGAPADFDTRK